MPIRKSSFANRRREVAASCADPRNVSMAMPDWVRVRDANLESLALQESSEVSVQRPIHRNTNP
jgi:hypothetical protein